MNNEKNGRARGEVSIGEKEIQVELIRSVIMKTFEMIHKIEGEVNYLQQVRGALKRDLIDLKEGRLDRILYRHGIDEISKENSIFTIEKKVEISGKSTSTWYIPYYLVIKGEGSSNGKKVDINNSVTKIHASGSYKMGNGEVKYL